MQRAVSKERRIVFDRALFILFFFPIKEKGIFFVFFFQAEDGIRDFHVTGVQTCAFRSEPAAVAEDAGWDGFFVWESVWGVDAWMALAAAAVRTERIRLGTMLTPLPRKRPWELAGQTATLDNLSGGRTILSVGLGAPHEGWLAFEPDPGRRTRAELLDEGLDVLTGLWAGQPFRYEGRHYRVTPTDFVPPPPLVQRPRIPIWV